MRKDRGPFAARPAICAILRLGIFICAGVSGLRPAAGASAPTVMPDAVGIWRAGPEDATRFRTASEDLGRWTRRVYAREAPVGQIEVNLMEGSGPGRFRAPEGDAEGLDGPLGSGAAYRGLEVAGRRAVLEAYPHMPLALAVAVSADATLTLESASASEAELAGMAGAILEALTRQEHP